ncbi:MAG: hypothetical protein JST44_17335 [Cyanobacteria bacterium SZAS LIN-5]|nr:hypothetical protein [Cyanobacteria bacterium SZAS LIN-5]
MAHHSSAPKRAAIRAFPQTQLSFLGDGNLPIEIGSPRTYIDPVPSAEPNTLFDSALTANPSAPAKPSEALELLRQDIAAHHDQKAGQSYLGQAISAVTSLGRPDTLTPVEQLNDQLKEAVRKGDTETAVKLSAEARGLVTADKQSLNTEQMISHYGAEMVKTAGLFVPGKPGYAISGAAYALDQAKPNDSLSNQLIDGSLGLTKGLGLKGSFDYLGAKDMGIALKAVSLGVSARVLDSALTRQTYTGADGRFDLADGLTKTFDTSFNKGALVSDVVTFGVAHKALGGINGVTGDALKKSPFWSTVATGAVFGVSAGSVQEINRQQQSGEKFDIQKILTSAALTGVTDMIAAAPGAKMMSSIQRQRAVTLDETTGRKAEEIDGSERSKINPNIQRNFPESNSREFQLIGNGRNVIEQLRAAPGEPVLAAVREVTASGVLGPPKNLVIQHVDSQTNGSAGSAVDAIKWGTFRGADLLASCNPELLPQSLRSKHIMPTAESVYLTQDQTGRLRFTDSEPTALKPGESQPVKLDKPMQQFNAVGTVSDIMRNPNLPQYIENIHDKTAIAKAMLHFKTPVRYFDSGADNITFEMPDRSILKVTDRGWDPSWGSREIWTKNGPKLTDALILRKPQTIELPDTSVTYFVQKRLVSPVTTAQLRSFDRLIEEDGTFKFWDNDFGEHGRRQVGMDPQTHELFLIDYDAMRLPHQVPKYAAESQETLIDRILDRYDE